MRCHCIALRLAPARFGQMGSAVCEIVTWACAKFLGNVYDFRISCNCCATALDPFLSRSHLSTLLRMFTLCPRVRRASTSFLVVPSPSHVQYLSTRRRARRRAESVTEKKKKDSPCQCASCPRTIPAFSGIIPLCLSCPANPQGAPLSHANLQYNIAYRIS